MDFHQFGMCIDIVEIWFGVANGQILSEFDIDSYLPETPIFSFLDGNLSKRQ